MALADRHLHRRGSAIQLDVGCTNSVSLLRTNGWLAQLCKVDISLRYCFRHLKCVLFRRYSCSEDPFFILHSKCLSGKLGGIGKDLPSPHRLPALLRSISLPNRCL